MKACRFSKEYAQKSSLHRIVGDTLRKPPFAAYRIYQEYPVVRINPSFRDGRCKFDWVILDLAVVVECHGEQHERPVRWSKEVSEDEAVAELYNTKQRDFLKKQAALDAGFTYVEVWYTDIEKVSGQYLLDLIQTNRNTGPIVIDPRKEALRQQMRRGYQKMKEARLARTCHQRSSDECR